MPITPEPADDRSLSVLQAAHLPPEPQERSAWLIQDLWAAQAVGIIGGAPRRCKTCLALETAIAVASGRPCLGHFTVLDPGPVLLFAAEDSLLHIRARLLGLAQARGVDFPSLPVFLILAQQIRLDLPDDKARLARAIDKLQPRLLILDPSVRLHRLDENSAMEVSALLAGLRALQRRFGLAVLPVHHTRKSNGEASGQTLRGSSGLQLGAIPTSTCAGPRTTFVSVSSAAPPGRPSTSPSRSQATMRRTSCSPPTIASRRSQICRRKSSTLFAATRGQSHNPSSAPSSRSATSCSPPPCMNSSTKIKSAAPMAAGRSLAEPIGSRQTYPI